MGDHAMQNIQQINIDRIGIVNDAATQLLTTHTQINEIVTDPTNPIRTVTII